MANQIEFKEVKYGVGDLVKVHFGTGNPFDGIIIGIKGRDVNKTMTVRKLGIGGIGIERIFPLSSPLLTKIEMKKDGTARRAKLYYLRTQTKKQLKKLNK